MNTVLHQPRVAWAAAAVIGIYFVAEWLFPPAVPAALVLSGLAIATIAAVSGAQRVVPASPATLLAIAGFALTLTGLITDDATRGSLDSAFKVLGAAAIFLIGTGPKLPVLLRLLFTGAGLAALVGYLASVSGHTASVDMAAAGMLATFPVLVSVIVLGCARLTLPERVSETDAVTV
ncbi:MAG: hypothetical protein ACSLFA_04940 [Mycobacterium sp.]